MTLENFFILTVIVAMIMAYIMLVRHYEKQQPQTHFEPTFPPPQRPTFLIAKEWAVVRIRKDKITMVTPFMFDTEDDAAEFLVEISKKYKRFAEDAISYEERDKYEEWLEDLIITSRLKGV